MNAFELATSRAIANTGNLASVRNLINTYYSRHNNYKNISVLYIHLLAVHNQLTRFKAKPSTVTLDIAIDSISRLLHDITSWYNDSDLADDLCTVISSILTELNKQVSLHIFYGLTTTEDSLSTIHNIVQSSIPNELIKLGSIDRRVLNEYKVKLYTSDETVLTMLQLKYYEKYGTANPLLRINDITETVTTLDNLRNVVALLDKAVTHHNKGN